MLSDEKLTAIADMHRWPIEFARAIEAEVRKADTELIRQMLEALETCNNADGYNGPYQYHDDKAVEAAVEAASARLEGKP